MDLWIYEVHIDLLFSITKSKSKKLKVQVTPAASVPHPGRQGAFVFFCFFLLHNRLLQT